MRLTHRSPSLRKEYRSPLHQVCSGSPATWRDPRSQSDRAHPLPLHHSPAPHKLATWREAPAAPAHRASLRSRSDRCAARSLAIPPLFFPRLIPLISLPSGPMYTRISRLPCLYLLPLLHPVASGISAELPRAPLRRLYVHIRQETFFPHPPVMIATFLVNFPTIPHFSPLSIPLQ